MNGKMIFYPELLAEDWRIQSRVCKGDLDQTPRMLLLGREVHPHFAHDKTHLLLPLPQCRITVTLWNLPSPLILMLLLPLRKLCESTHAVRHQRRHGLADMKKRHFVCMAPLKSCFGRTQMFLMRKSQQILINPHRVLDIPVNLDPVPPLVTTLPAKLLQLCKMLFRNTKSMVSFHWSQNPQFACKSCVSWWIRHGSLSTLF
mmetsp:Transcript_3506/g.13404  ORF Transcript_3506/g.13404 Transcript_3506/m.13404 type:complete len:202 (+) Transcript_3506:810-1415(+)